MISVIKENGGIVNKIIGDSIMAVFGLSSKDGDNIEINAIKTAVEMHKQLDKLNNVWSNSNKKVLNMGIGIASGLFILANIGSDDRMEFTCIGDIVNTAKRLEGLAGTLKKEIIISDSFLKNSNNEISEFCNSIGAVSLKGKNKEVKVYSVDRGLFASYNNSNTL